MMKSTGKRQGNSSFGPCFWWSRSSHRFGFSFGGWACERSGIALLSFLVLGSGYEI